jgi:hypothetical protein
LLAQHFYLPLFIKFLKYWNFLCIFLLYLDTVLIYVGKWNYVQVPNKKLWLCITVTHFIFWVPITQRERVNCRLLSDESLDREDEAWFGTLFYSEKYGNMYGIIFQKKLFMCLIFMSSLIVASVRVTVYMNHFQHYFHYHPAPIKVL